MKLSGVPIISGLFGGVIVGIITALLFNIYRENYRPSSSLLFFEVEYIFKRDGPWETYTDEYGLNNVCPSFMTGDLSR